MAAAQNTGHLGNLTVDQEYKLKEHWLAILTNFGTAPKGLKVGGKAPAPEKKSGRFGFGSKTITPEAAYEEAIGSFAHMIQGVPVKDIQSRFYDMVRADHPDQVMLRFLRARKWDLPRATEMFGKTVKWRTTEYNIEDMLKKGEVYWINKEPDQGFINQYKTGKAMLVGRDKENRPVITIQVKKHDPRAQSEEAMRRYVLFNMESSRLTLNDQVETAGIIFDLGGFGLHNMDYAVVKFLIECFEAHYPESLGYLYIHNAPWIFSGVWNVIKGWIDPVVASKIAFTKGDKDLLKKINADQLPVEIGGTGKDVYHWVPPIEGEDAPMQDTATAEQILSERKKLFAEFDKLTLEWIQADGEASKNIYAKRNEVVKEIQANYWKSDPYVRSRGVYDRIGTLGKFRAELAPGGVAQPVLK